MIRFITPTKLPDVVVGDGPQFQFHDVLDTGFRMLRAAADAIRRAHPDARLASSLPCEDVRLPFFDADAELVLKTAMVDLKSQIDVADHWCVLEAWPYAISFHPFGDLSLMKTVEGYRTTDGTDLRELDPTPELTVTRSLLDAQGRPSDIAYALADAIANGVPSMPKKSARDVMTLTEVDIAFVSRVWQRFFDCGVTLRVRPMQISARFPHDIFGAGRGPVRIRVVDS